jgi:hypothetical protein
LLKDVKKIKPHFIENVALFGLVLEEEKKLI